jgi:AraC-like DNA-binding protein/NTP pyrophosphatase (non-canonical NTP hydrolase)
MQSRLTGWKYVTVLPVKLALSKVEQAKRIFLYGVGAILVGGGAIIFLNMRWNYKPIHQLKMDSLGVLSPLCGGGLNEIETVRYALNSLAIQNKELDERVKNTSSAARKQFMLSLLKGEFETPLDMQECARETGCSIEGTRVKTMIIEFSGCLPGRKQPGAQELEQLLPLYSPIAMEHFEPKRYVIVLLTDEDTQEEKVHEDLRHFRETLYHHFQVPVTVGVGTQVCPAEGPRSYLEAQMSIEYRFILGTNRFIAYQDLPKPSNWMEEYPHQEMQELIQAVRKSDRNRMQDSLEKVICFIRHRQPRLIVARSLCLDMIRLVNETGKSLGLSDQDMNRFPDIFYLEQLETIDEAAELITSLRTELYRNFEDQQTAEERNSSRSIEAMFQHIDEHYRNCDFSLQSMSDHFGMALPNLSRYFKEKTGQTLLDYVTLKRMEKAKLLLAHTTMPLKEVANEVGYQNVSSFIRRFRQVYACTPGEFRK